MADLLDRILHRAPIVGPESNGAAAEKTPLEDFAVDGDGALENHPGAGLQLLSGMHQRFPAFV